MASYTEKKTNGMSLCPWPRNTDCICRSGACCGGFKWGNESKPDKCPYYQKLLLSEINHIQTKLMNDCENCKHFGRSTCREGGCNIISAICLLEDMKRKTKPTDDTARGNITNSHSGTTFRGKETQ